MKRLVPILVVEIIVLCRPLPTQQRQFPIVKNNGCAAIKNSVDPVVEIPEYKTLRMFSGTLFTGYASGDSTKCFSGNRQ
ncbi:uncharacterized protein LOC27208377 isoform X4 [Drosophila simulans]|uniref:uncharacterized protein LOC27208377 isoform X4 n=1 Tax=Drosophila simulans TaxID=7240 RepID=UPI001D10E6CF|nr:uncharacterized protein LOC27208377 isoform X4 [Drosophila simulans]